MIVGQSMRVVLIGSVLGLAAATGFARLMMGLLFGVGAVDLPTLAAVSTLGLLIAALAAYIPLAARPAPIRW